MPDVPVDEFDDGSEFVLPFKYVVVRLAPERQRFVVGEDRLHCRNVTAAVPECFQGLVYYASDAECGGVAVGPESEFVGIEVLACAGAEGLDAAVGEKVLPFDLRKRENFHRIPFVRRDSARHWWRIALCGVANPVKRPSAFQ